MSCRRVVSSTSTSVLKGRTSFGTRTLNLGQLQDDTLQGWLTKGFGDPRVFMGLFTDFSL